MQTANAPARSWPAAVLLGGSLAAYIAVVYTAGVVGIGALTGSGTHNAWLTILSTTVIAVTFERVRERARREISRILYGERATPLEVLDRFSRGLEETGSGEQALGRMARMIADGTGASVAEVWVASGDGFLLAASFPEGALGRVVEALPSGDLVAPVRHQGELLGALVVTKGPAEPATLAEERLLNDVASQAGLALRNVRLRSELALRIEQIAHRADELRASRRRVVAAQDTERRRLERDIHDGAQQHLVALAVKLRLARTLVAKDATCAPDLLRELDEVTKEAIENLRDLTRGIYPPLLAEKGIVAALRARVERSPIPVRLETDGIRRYPLAVEAAVYFTCLEALQNALKYSSASRIDIRLSETPAGLAFSVTDDGAGFDAAAARSGSGLVNLTDRVAAIGGTVRVASAPGRGTSITGDLPASAVAS